MIWLAAIVLATSSLSFSLVALIVGRREIARLVPLAPRALDEPLLVVIPARNEPDIGACIASVLADPSPSLRVLVVDDRSDDDTGARAAAAIGTDARARVLRLEDDPPAGVFGKPRALHAARTHVEDAPARLLFLDADVRLAPGALGALVEAHARTEAAALSGVPALDTRGVIEALFVPTLAGFVTSRFLPSRVHDAKDATAFLNGQLILVSRDALDAVGGWASVQDTVLEDVALARRLKQAGHALRLADVRALASTRMYASFAAIAEGFGKNAVALVGPRAGALGLSAFVMASLPWLAAALALVDRTFIEGTLALVAGSIACAVLARASAGVPRWPALLLPIAYAGAAVVLVRASVRHLRRAPTVWKGRAYPPRARE